MSGFIYNILHDIPLTMTDKKGNLQWMTTHEGRSQLGAEGLIMSISSNFKKNIFVPMISREKQL